MIAKETVLKVCISGGYVPLYTAKKRGKNIYIHKKKYFISVQ